MKPETKVVLEEYKARFKTYKDFLDKNDWVNDVKENEKGTLYSEKLNTEFAIVKSILESMDKFKADVGEDVTLKVVKDFIQSTVKIIKSHVAKIDKYEKQNPLSNNDTEGGNLEEFNFQTKLFQNKVKSKVALSKLNIDEEELSRKSLDLFFGNVKAPLMMRDYLYDKFDVIKNKTDALDVNFSVPHINPATSNELLINMKPKDIPPWDSTKHFFEQEKSTIQFWEEEKIKIKNGINIGGYHLSGWLYWHTNIFKLNYGAEDEKDIKVALFRDNEYFFDYMYNKAKSPEYGRHGLFLYGTRRYSKSSGMSSRLLYGLWTIKNASATVQGFSKVPDLEALIKYSSDAIGEMYPALKMPANNLTLDDGIVLGLKDKKAQNRFDFANLSIINLEGGNTKKGSQKTAGSTPDIFLLDEALHKDEHVVTDNGFIRIEDVNIGDKIYDHTGNLTTVLDKIDVGVKQLYEVEFSDGRKIKSCGDHMWGTYNKNNNYRILTTSDIIKKMTPTNPFYIPITKPVNYSERKLPIDPYFLGYLIGDGGLTGYSINISFLPQDEHEVIQNIKQEFDRFGCEIKKTQNSRLRLNKNKKLRDEILKLNLNKPSWEKDIPAIYKISSVEQRFELLKGLLDSDGCCYVYSNNKSDKLRSVTTFTTTSEKLKDSVIEVCNSLGIVVTAHSRQRKRSGKLNRISWELIIQTDIDLFKIKRKSLKVLKRTHGNHTKISIKKITPIGKDQAYCIKVDNTDKLFLTTMFTVTHNCGKGKSIPPWKAAMPSFAGGKNGKWRLVPMLSGTAGEGALSVDAEAMLKDPKGYSIMPMDWDHLEEFVDPDYITWERNNFGFFVPAQMSLEAPDKIIQPFGDFLNTGINTKKLDLTELNKLNIHVTDWKKAKEFFEQKRENVKNDLSLLAGETNSFPLTPEDCYVSSEKNKFPGLECKNRRKYVEDYGLQGQKVWLVKNGDRVETIQTNDAVITDYPYKGGNFDAPIVILDDPYDKDGNKPPLGLYCIGFDDVKQEKSSGDSVMSATVFKRSYEQGEWANRVVAYYDSRPERKKDYYRNLYLLIKFYNARILHENEDNGFVDYMEDNHMDEIYTHLSDGVGLATEENLNRNKNRKFGWSPTPLNIYNLEQTMVMYTKEEGVKIGEEEGLTGVDRINHPMLLEEFYKYKKDLNADRIRSFGLALKLARYYDKTNAYMKFRKKQFNEEETSFKKKKRTIGVKGFSFTNKLKKF